MLACQRDRRPAAPVATFDQIALARQAGAERRAHERGGARVVRSWNGRVSPHELIAAGTVLFRAFEIDSGATPAAYRFALTTR
jgi:hypothetical protein